MTRYAVIWHDDARVEAIRLLTESPDVNVIIDAIQDLGERLALSPRNAVHLHEGLWKITLPPFSVFYEIHEDHKRVEIHLIVER